jgi:hypothetical protein
LKNGLFVRLIFIIDHFSSPSEVDYKTYCSNSQ